MKKRIKIIAMAVAVPVAGWFCLPYYARQALIHRHPDIDDLHLFERHVVRHADSCREWPLAARYNERPLSPAWDAYLDSLGTVAFLVARGDSILHEEYRDGWNDTLTSNLFSATKSIVGLLAGVALGEGAIGSLDEPVGNYLPEYREGRKARVTIRHLLTMSGGLGWDEAYSSLFSATTRGYYGRDLYRFVTGLDVVDEPGERFSYRSGETQLLALVVERATGKSISDLAAEKLWGPLQACRDAYWLLDRREGDEKAFCCFHSNARDVARLGRLLLNGGEWNGRQVVPREYAREATRPATYTGDRPGDPPGCYGFQIWIARHRGLDRPYLRGMLGQYVILLPERDAVVVRLGRGKDAPVSTAASRDVYRYIDLATSILDRVP